MRNVAGKKRVELYVEEGSIEEVCGKEVPSDLVRVKVVLLLAGGLMG